MPLLPVEENKRGIIQGRKKFPIFNFVNLVFMSLPLSVGGI
jgi:hypothetical protein